MVAPAADEMTPDRRHASVLGSAGGEHVGVNAQPGGGAETDGAGGGWRSAPSSRSRVKVCNWLPERVSLKNRPVAPSTAVVRVRRRLPRWMLTGPLEFGCRRSRRGVSSPGPVLVSPASAKMLESIVRPAVAGEYWWMINSPPGGRVDRLAGERDAAGGGRQQDPAGLDDATGAVVEGQPAGDDGVEPQRVGGEAAGERGAGGGVGVRAGGVGVGAEGGQAGDGAAGLRGPGGAAVDGGVAAQDVVGQGRSWW